MRKGWELYTLEDLCIFLNGLWTGKVAPFLEVGVIRNTNFTKDGNLDDSDIAYLQVEKKQFDTRQLQYGDIIIEKSGGGPKQPVGRVVVFDKKDGLYSFSNFTSVIRIKNLKLVHFRYLHCYLHFQYLSGATESMQSHSTGIRNLKFDEYKKIEIPVPTLQEQKQIVTILDKAFAAIDKAKANAEQNLKNAKELFESYLNEVFEDVFSKGEIVPLSSLATVIGGYSFKSTDFKTSGKYQVIRIGNVRPGIIRDNESPIYIDKIEDKVLERARLSTNDIVITQTGTKKKRDYGYTAIIEKDNYLLNQRVAAIRTSEKYLPKFFLYFSWTNIFKNQYFENETGTVGQGNVGIGAITNANVPIIPIKAQKNLVKKIDEIQDYTCSARNLYERKLADLEDLKKSILQKAFSGELTSKPIPELV